MIKDLQYIVDYYDLSYKIYKAEYNTPAISKRIRNNGYFLLFDDDIVSYDIYTKSIIKEIPLNERYNLVFTLSRALRILSTHE